MKYILAMGRRDSYALFGAQVHVIVTIVFNINHLLSDEKYRKRKHCRAAVIDNFKLDIIIYDVPGNKNSKLTHQVYIDSILEPVVKPWIMAREDFVLEENDDSDHGPSKKIPCAHGKNRTVLILISTVLSRLTCLL